MKSGDILKPRRDIRNIYLPRTGGQMFMEHTLKTPMSMLIIKEP